LLRALGDLLDDPAQDPAFVAECLLPPDEVWLGERIEAVDPVHLHAVREDLRSAIGGGLAAALERQLELLGGDDGSAVDAQARTRRRLKNVALSLRMAHDAQGTAARAFAQLHAARNMTDRLAALTELVHHDIAGADDAAAAFQRSHAGDPLVLDKWLALHAGSPQPGTAQRVRALMSHESFSWRNPNKVRALIGSFARNNRVAFHAADGDGYRLLSSAVLSVDRLNPQVAARLVTAFNGFRRLEPQRRALMRGELQRLAAEPALSTDVAEIVLRALGQDGTR
jgi:aminopeptidase N